MQLKSRTIGLVGLGAAVVVGLLYVTLRTEPVPVDLHVVTTGPMQVTIDADGKTRIRDIFEVAAPITGTALRSPVSVGDTVTVNKTVVAIVEPIAPGLLDARARLQAEAAIREAEAARHVAQTDLDKAREDQALAQVQHARTQTLVERNVASTTSLEDAAQRLSIATATVEAAQARIDMANSSLERSRAALIDPNTNDTAFNSCCVRITAPANGVVLSIGAISERPVTAGTPLLSIGDTTNIELVADLLSSDAVRLTPGTRARIERWGGPAPLDAVLDRIEPSARTKVSALGIEEQRVDAVFTITSSIADRPNLGHGFAAFVRIIEWKRADALQVPLGAIFKRDDAWAVFVAVDDIVEERPVSLGMRNTMFAEILGGLDAGDHVITHPSDNLKVGDLIVDRNGG